jgi:hypothetical protein
MTIESWFGLFGSSLLIAAAFAAPLSKINADPRWKAGVVVLILLAFWVPVRGLAAVGYLRGIVGDLSVTTMIVLGMTIFTRLSSRQWLTAREQTFWSATIGIAALFLYPMALGLGTYDPYQLGFGSYTFATAILILTIAAWLANHLWMVSSILASVTAYLLTLLDSTNLWDYLIDPLLVCLALYWLVRRGWNHCAQAPNENMPSKTSH